MTAISAGEISEYLAKIEGDSDRFEATVLRIRTRLRELIEEIDDLTGPEVKQPAEPDEQEEGRGGVPEKET